MINLIINNLIVLFLLIFNINIKLLNFLFYSYNYLQIHFSLLIYKNNHNVKSKYKQVNYINLFKHYDK